MKILIIEDNEIETENLQILLGKFDGCDVIGAADTIKEGIEIANSQHPVPSSQYPVASSQ